MAFLHRALSTWFVVLIFLILLALRLEQKTRWSWFIVFIPMWIYDGVVLIYLVFTMISICKNRRDRGLRGRRKIWYLICALLKISFQIMICIKLEYPNIHLPVYYIMIPVWIVLPVTIVDLFSTLREPRRPH